MGSVMPLTGIAAVQQEAATCLVCSVIPYQLWFSGSWLGVPSLATAQAMWCWCRGNFLLWQLLLHPSVMGL